MKEIEFAPIYFGLYIPNMNLNLRSISNVQSQGQYGYLHLCLSSVFYSLSLSNIFPYMGFSDSGQNSMVKKG